jgi:hypothetical protein
MKNILRIAISNNDEPNFIFFLLRYLITFLFYYY